MEPPAVLIGAFHVDVGNAVLGPVLTVAQHKSVGRARVEPHVQHVKHLIIVIGVGYAVEDLLFEPIGVPDIRAILLERRLDAGVEFRVAQQVIRVGGQSALLGKAGQWHAPGALAGQNPVRARFDHRKQTIATGLRRPLHQLVD